MKRALKIFLFLLTTWIIWQLTPAHAQLPTNNIAAAAVSLQVTTNGVLVAPTNFFRTNMTALTNALIQAGFTTSSAGAQTPLSGNVNMAGFSDTNGSSVQVTNNLAITNAAGTNFISAVGQTNTVGGAVIYKQNNAGAVTATSFSGNGSALTSLTVANVTGLGTLALMSSNNPTVNGLTNFGLLVLGTNSAFPGTVASGLWYDTGGQASTFWNQGHPGGGEMQITSYGSISINAGYGNGGGSDIQIGSSGGQHDEINFQYDLQPDAVTPIGYSKNIHMTVPYFDGFAESINLGFRGEARSTNGDVRLIFYNPSPNHNGAYGSNAVYSGGGDQGEMLTNGWNLRGRQIRSLQQITYGTNLALDFGTNGLALNTTINQSNTWFYTTNWASGTTNLEEKIFLIHSGFIIPNLFFPTNWTWLSAVPTMTNNQICCLKLTCVGQGESNVLACANVGYDYVFAGDPDAVNFAAINSITDGAHLTALNALVTDLKNNGLWTIADAVYPFAGTTSAQNAWNLKNTNNFKITWHGTVTHNANGITGDGSTGYGDTGFTPSTAGGSFTQNSCSWAVWAKTTTPNSSSYIMAVVAGTRDSTLYTSPFSRLDGPNVNTTANSTITYTTGLLGGSRTSSSTAYQFVGGIAGGNISTASTGLPTASFYILGGNNGGLDSPTTANLAFGWIGGGLTSAQMATLNTIIAKFEATLGR